MSDCRDALQQALDSRCAAAIGAEREAWKKKAMLYLKNSVGKGSPVVEKVPTVYRKKAYEWLLAVNQQLEVRTQDLRL
eukprot:10559678-Heterocapsa_arctica.AAC.1